jgi:ABC-type iron transport system FetAB permease component
MDNMNSFQICLEIRERAVQQFKDAVQADLPLGHLTHQRAKVAYKNVESKVFRARLFHVQKKMSLNVLLTSYQ